MIPGCSANGQFANQSLGMPIVQGAKDATVKLQPTYKVRPTLQPQYKPLVKRLPRAN